MSIEVYKILHLVGVIFLFLSIGALILRALEGGPHGVSDTGRGLSGMTHGIALLLILVSGFGLLAKYQIGFPAWVWIKVLVWLVLGSAVAFVRKMPSKAKIWWWLLPLLGVLAAYLGVMKPGTGPL